MATTEIDLDLLRKAARELKRVSAHLLAEARREGRCPDPEDHGFVAGKAGAAADAVFDVVNSADAYLDYPGAREALDAWNITEEVEA